MTQSLVLFDLDGTLTNPKLGITSGVQHALKKFGIDETDVAKLETFIGPPLRQTFMEKYGFSEDDAKRAVTYYREYFDPIGWRENEVYEGIPEVLRALRDGGVMIGLATSKPTVFADRILNHFGLRDAFAVVVGSNLDGTREDKAEVIRAALDEAAGLVTEMGGSSADNRAAEAGDSTAHPRAAEAGDSTAHPRDSIAEALGFVRVTMVGDRKYDIIGAKHWGLRTVGVTYGFGTREELASAGADDIVDAPLQLTDVLLHQ